MVRKLLMQKNLDSDEYVIAAMHSIHQDYDIDIDPRLNSISRYMINKAMTISFNISDLERLAYFEDNKYDIALISEIVFHEIRHAFQYINRDIVIDSGDAKDYLLTFTNKVEHMKKNDDPALPLYNSELNTLRAHFEIYDDNDDKINEQDAQIFAMKIMEDILDGCSPLISKENFEKLNEKWELLYDIWVYNETPPMTKEILTKMLTSSPLNLRELGELKNFCIDHIKDIEDNAETEEKEES